METRSGNCQRYIILNSHRRNNTVKNAAQIGEPTPQGKMMANAPRFGGRALERPTPFRQWLIGTATFALEELVETLSEPHYTEHDLFRTAGGLEDHWAFEFEDGIRIGILYRRPYQEATFFADPPDVQSVLTRIEPCLQGRDFKAADPPLLIE